MAGTKISDLPSAGALTGAELVPVVQSDVTKKTTITDILTSAGAGTVTSVNVSGGSTGLTTSGGPITTSGTITLAGTLDVDNGGTGATTASTARSNLGAAASGTNSDITSMTGVTGGISTPDFVQFDTAAGATTAVAKQYWDDNSGGLSYGMKGGNVTQNIGQQVYQRVYNNTGATIAKGSVVYATGSSGTRTTIAKALATSDGTSAAVIGITAENISNNSEGFIITEGEITGVSTSGIGDGEILWLSATTAGAYTDVKTVAPNHLVLIGYCVKGNSVGGGIVYVKLENGYEIGELHDVYVSSPANGQTLLYNATNSRWENHNLTAGSGITITNGAGSVTIAASAGGGTVTSVNVSGGTTGLTTSGGPVTGSGTITLAGTLDVDNGGTGQTSYSNGQLLIGNASGGLTKATLTAGSGISITNGNGSITLTAAGSGLGDVTGPASATDNAVARFDGTTGKIIKNTSDFTIDANNNVGIGGVATTTKVNVTGLLPEVGGESYAIANRGTVKSTTSSLPVGVLSQLNTQSAGSTWTLGTYYHFAAENGTAGTNAVLNGQIGFHSPDLTIGQSAIGYNSSVNVGSNKWNIYAGGSAQNYFRGNVGIGVSNTTPGSELDVKGTIRLSGSTSGYVGLAPAAAAGSTTYTLPSADGTNGQVLKTNGSGTLSWISVGGSGTVTSVDASGGTTGMSFTGGPITGAGTLTLTGTLDVDNGGTGQTSYTDGQLLIGNSTGNTLTKATLTAGSGISITNGSGSISIAATNSGTVTSVGQTFTGGLISVAGSPVTSSGTLALTVAGTSGGIPYFSSGTTWASSGALAANAIVVGGGAGAAPSTVTTGTGVVTALGVNTGSAGAFVVNGGALGTPSSGTLTNATGLPVSSGISGFGTGVATALAVNTGTAGAFVVNGGALGTPSSGTLTNATGLPLSTGVTGTLPVGNGGTGATTLTGVLKGNGTSAFTAATAGTDYVAPATATNFTATQTFTGSSSTLAMVLANSAETTTVSATAATGTINYDVTTQSVLYYTTNASANWTVNFRASSGTSLNTLLSTGQSITVVFLATQGATAYYNNAVTVDGVSVTPKYQGGTAWSSGNASGIDAYTYVILKTGNAAFTIFASQTQFK